MAKAKNKKQNFLVSYFLPFGIRQICDLLMLTGVILLIIGLCLNNIVLVIGLSVILAASAIAVLRMMKVLFSKINKRSPEYKNAIVNSIVMGIVLILAVVGIIFYFV